MVVVVLPRLTERGGLEPGCTVWGSWTLTTSRWDERAFLSVLFAFLCLKVELLVTINLVNGSLVILPTLLFTLQLSCKTLKPVTMKPPKQLKNILKPA